MTSRATEVGRAIAAVGGVLLIVSLFLPWASVDGTNKSGFELLTIADVFLLIVALVALWAALTWGRFGLFRPDVSVNGAADLLAVVASIVLVWFVVFDFPSGAHRGVGAFLALVATIAVAGGTGDYGVLRGAALFPRIDQGERRRH
jgi:fumarate reductase subunit D